MYIATCLKNVIFVFYVVVVVVVVVVGGGGGGGAADAAAVCGCIHTSVLCLNIEIIVILSYLCIFVYTVFLHVSNYIC